MVMMKGNEHPEERVPLYKPKTEQKLREKIFDWINDQSCHRCEFWDRQGHFCFLENIHADTKKCKLLYKILALFKEALPELVKEAGYVLPNSKGMTFDGIVDTLTPDEILHKWARDNGYKSPEEVAEFGLSVNEAAFAQARVGYVRLSEDQSLPENPFPQWRTYDDEIKSINYSQAQEDMLKGDASGVWRKVIL